MDGLILGVLFIGVIISFLICQKLYNAIIQSTNKLVSVLFTVCVFILIMGLLGAVMVYYHNTQMRRYYPYNGMDSTLVDSTHIDTLRNSERSKLGKLKSGE